MVNRVRLWAAGAVIALALPLSAWAQAVDLAKSSVSAVSKQMGVPVEGKFKKFTASVSFDPAKPQDAKASIDIDMTSFDIGADDVNAEVKKPEWFGTAKFPKASFVAASAKAAAPNRFEVSGKLTIKGKTQDVVVPVTLKAEAATNTYEGAIPIKRLAFNIGEGEWKDTSMVADEVQVKFKIVTAKK